MAKLRVDNVTEDTDYLTLELASEDITFPKANPRARTYRDGYEVGAMGFFGFLVGFFSPILLAKFGVVNFVHISKIVLVTSGLGGMVAVPVACSIVERCKQAVGSLISKFSGSKKQANQILRSFDKMPAEDVKLLTPGLRAAIGNFDKFSKLALRQNVNGFVNEGGRQFIQAQRANGRYVTMTILFEGAPAAVSDYTDFVGQTLEADTGVTGCNMSPIDGEVVDGIAQAPSERRATRGLKI